MKILVIQDRLRSGGTERQAILLARAARAAGHAAELLTFRPGGALAAGCAELMPRSLQPFDLGLDWFAPGLFAAARRAAPDIAVCMGRMANCYGGALQRALPRSSVVATLRTGKPLPWLFRRSLRRVRHILANSRDARERALRDMPDLPPDKITVIRNALTLPPSAPEGRRESLRRELGAGEGTLALLCVAMFRPEKNQRELLETAAGLPPSRDWRLWLAGDGPARAACERRARELGLGGRVRFLGYHPDPTGLYAAADLAVHASRSDSLSNFVIEAQSAGLPAVAYEAMGLRECFVEGRTGWALAAGDRQGFRAAVARYAAEPAPARRLRAAEARDYARKSFDSARQLAAHLELFKLLRGSS